MRVIAVCKFVKTLSIMPIANEMNTWLAFYSSAGHLRYEVSLT